MNKNLYIGNLSVKVTEEDLKANFSEVGKVVTVNIIKDKYTGLSRGFGFVEMETEEGAKEAIQRFNGGQLLGNTITVNEVYTSEEVELLEFTVDLNHAEQGSYCVDRELP